ncbi:hypothetical protein F4677DRAFT_446592 [Hypoxylon crocopeplum]|nr:hypothetical protein F4677DRAFT_446592 [Hypoxylon crocopeplum]
MSTRPSKTHYASSSSTSSDSSSPSSSESDLSIRFSMDVQPVASVEVMRCLRCHRHVEATSTDDPASTGMIRVGFNLYYCQKCATAVGYNTTTTTTKDAIHNIPTPFFDLHQRRLGLFKTSMDLNGDNLLQSSMTNRTFGGQLHHARKTCAEGRQLTTNALHLHG